MDDQVIFYLGLERDQNLRPDTSAETLAKLKPVFGGPEGTMTASNSTPLSDGASAVLLASEEWAAAHEIPVQAFVTRPKPRPSTTCTSARACDGSRLRDASDAGPSRRRAPGVRLLRDP